MARVFISHATPDREFVEQVIIPLLESNGVETWLLLVYYHIRPDDLARLWTDPVGIRISLVALLAHGLGVLVLSSMTSMKA
jgi:hypothetical protein